MGDMRLLALESGDNPEREWAMDRLGEVWEEEGPSGHFYEPAYRRRAEQIVEAWRASRAPLKWGVRESLYLPLAGGGQLEITADAITQEPGGNVYIARHKLGRPRGTSKDLRNDDRHALFVAAANETWPGRTVDVVVHHLPGNEIVEAKPADKVVARRVDKLKGYAERISEGDFRPNPGHECKSCNWNLICPSSV